MKKLPMKNPPNPRFENDRGVPVLPGVGKRVTFEDVQRIQEELDEEDAQRAMFPWHGSSS